MDYRNSSTSKEWAAIRKEAILKEISERERRENKKVFHSLRTAIMEMDELDEDALNCSELDDDTSNRSDENSMNVFLARDVGQLTDRTYVPSSIIGDYCIPQKRPTAVSLRHQENKNVHLHIHVHLSDGIDLFT